MSPAREMTGPLGQLDLQVSQGLQASQVIREIREMRQDFIVSSRVGGLRTEKPLAAIQY